MPKQVQQVQHEKQAPRRTGWKRAVVGTLKWGTIVGLSLLLVGAVVVFIAYQRTSIPQPNDLADNQVSVLYYADGKTELDRIAVAQGNRESVALSAVPKHVRDAHIAAEDRTFYDNNGISPAGILRAIKTSVTGEAQVGGSTITQQYVKNYFLTQDRTLTRKAREILIAVKIDGQLTKDEILEKYLNTIYYGRGAYGIQSAAKAYFGKNVGQLTVAEGAVLASVINAPSLFDPAQGDDAAAKLDQRFAYVLDGMVTMGTLSAADRAELTSAPKTIAYQGNRFSAGPVGHVTASVRRELIASGLTEEDIDNGGLRIVTTIEKKAQDAAVAAMRENLPEQVQGGLVAMRPGDGAVVAMWGGADYAKSQLNTSTQAIMQAGSNFKPFTVLAAVRDGLSTRTRFDGSSPQEFGDTTINNFAQRSYGRVDMRRMVGRSINTAFVALNEQIGPDKTRQAAIDAGIPAKTPGLEDNLTNVLGTSSPHVIDMATGYSTIAAQGQRSAPYFVRTVTSTVSDYTYEAAPKPVRAFDADVTADVTDAMTYTVKPGGTATKLQSLDRPVAGKTGTSEENKSVWFSGFVPQLAVSVAMYKPDAAGNPQTLTDNEGYNLTGGTVPADIFMDFMTPVLDGVEVADFPERAGVGDDKAPTVTPSPTQAPTESPTETPTETPTTEPSTTTTTEPSTTTTSTGPPAPTSTEPSTTTTSTGPPAPTSTEPPKPPKPTATAPPTTGRPRPTTSRVPATPGPARPARPSATAPVAPAG